LQPWAMWRNPFGIRSRGFANNTGLLGNGKPWVKAYGPSRVGAKEPSVLLGHGTPWVKRRPLHTRSAVARMNPFGLAFNGMRNTISRK
ncbi:MAG: hypothetical protein SGI71_13225, partial [Verrucomicrobiota bacterium]|nr:hypothetical protein [Verrucomicrobiota bacterium]